MVATGWQSTDFHTRCGIGCFKWLRAVPSHAEGPYGCSECEAWMLRVPHFAGSEAVPCWLLCTVCDDRVCSLP